MKTYKITEKTAGQRNAKVIETNLELKDAYKELLDLFNRRHGLNAKNWGLAVIMTKDNVDGACKTFSDGTRSFEYDNKTYDIVEEEMTGDEEEMTEDEE